MSRYGGNTPCIEVVSSNGGHRLVFDLGSGAFDLGQKILGEMFSRKKMESEGGNDEKKLPQLGGSIFITHTHWDHIQGMLMFYTERDLFWKMMLDYILMLLTDMRLDHYQYYRPAFLRPPLPPSVSMENLWSGRSSENFTRGAKWTDAT